MPIKIPNELPAVRTLEAILAGVQSEKYDLGISGITITEERKESMDFSDVYHVEDLAVIIRSEEGTNDLSQFNTATLGVVTGSLYGGYSKEQFPRSSFQTQKSRSLITSLTFLLP